MTKLNLALKGHGRLRQLIVCSCLLVGDPAADYYCDEKETSARCGTLPGSRPGSRKFSSHPYPADMDLPLSDCSGCSWNYNAYTVCRSQ